ncbi:hypothetical protein J6R97_04715 [bacterium]|nr:hypothetical protein [bacterium]
MAEAFNLNTFLKEQAGYITKKYTASENAQAAMEAREIEKAKNEVNKNSFLNLTLSEKLNELGLGKRVMQQFGETAIGTVENIVSPFTEWLEQYEHVYDEKIYNTEIQSYAKQMFFANQALSKEAASDKVGQNFVYKM